ncbi:hypothetical protein SEA_PLATTE_86 [Microbacterium phage Platte]|nr:hypothetical protein SEA_HORTUS1_87 [Microbacterium phage Hortus1]AWY05657.1 hypothetical protein SEA_OLINDD_87 [Microbacterium phage OlinDD]AWY05910.1 hypothetical protein SEA_PIONEER3_87 [Microbacterium phage Pioneer3]AWY06416.1 hypothetical protein SEA_TANDEM_87 [Microbacterium phage Tandem]QAU07417.1 hypothetical protein SEA_ALLEB_85 [Microbacterium phage Alleb]QZD97678.1 hypothetical protein SEA_PLATTE_86 [Microbacterium phage Platte]
MDGNRLSDATLRCIALVAFLAVIAAGVIIVGA